MSRGETVRKPLLDAILKPGLTVTGNRNKVPFRVKNCHCGKVQGRLGQVCELSGVTGTIFVEEINLPSTKLRHALFNRRGTAAQSESSFRRTVDAHLMRCYWKRQDVI
ncbi:hypothetical protein Pla110_03520 [Polystyrenella longa]|uniref:Uncharacterized protein n=1 Tax=Polystyrenella longa TaxID=2528007 RepID=A0A518CHE1_9PLAN|nr:hypothetical protein Pla110_03520 [Polystyrenella longa]